MEFETISARELDDYTEQAGTVIVDLRTPGEYARGHYRGALNVPYEQYEELFPASKVPVYVLYCQRGSQSMAASRVLVEKGYRIKTVVGGIRAYRGANLVK